MRKSSLQLIFICGMLLFQLGCTTKKSTSYLVIAIDDLSSTDVLCTSDQYNDTMKSGFAILCAESIRFTHAYTPSLQSVPTLASLLTGLYPIEHGTRHNGQTLSASLDTNAEIAVKNGYRTAFFSGGAPVLRKTGLNQGFELFDDEFILSPQHIHRAVHKNINNFIDWLDESSAKRFFSFIYIPDLIFTHIPTANSEGELRSYSFNSQLEEVDEALYGLFARLKDKDQWNNTQIIVLGLTGHSQSERPNEPGPMNLNSENTQVALFVKPATPPRDLALSWKIDRNVTLVDIGHTLRDQLGGNDSPLFNSFPTLSLKFNLKDLEKIIPQKRPILIETAWPSWRYKLGPRYAFVYDKYVWIHDTEPKIYNSLIDHFENTPMALNLSLLKEFEEILKLTQEKQLEPFPGLTQKELLKRSIHFSTWMRPDRKDQLIRELQRISSSEKDQQDLKNYILRTLLLQGQYSSFHNYLAKANGFNEFKHISAIETELLQSDSCYHLLNIDIDSNKLKLCSDDLWVEFVAWVRAADLGLNAEVQRARFERKLWYHLIDQNLVRTNLAINHIWDLNSQLQWQPSRSEVALLNPRWHKQRAMVENSLRFLNKIANDQQE
ncbi:MAG: sulfatase-like hydrolase/transferase [Bdellovibrionia bacterium]